MICALDDCDATFTTDHPGKRFCSHTCQRINRNRREQAARNNRPHETCIRPGCQETFLRRNTQLYCGVECRKADQRDHRRHPATQADAERTGDLLRDRLAHLLDCEERGVKCDPLPTSIQLTRAAS